MNSRATTGLRVASFVFALITVAQLLRLVTGAEVVVAGHALPLWPSALAILVFGGLSGWLWSLAGRPAS